MASHHATLFLNAGIKEYSQWFLGWENNVVDALLRDFDRSNDELTQILRITCPSQLPLHFQIVLLPSEMSLWLTLLLQKLPVKEQLREAHTRTKLGRGVNFPSISNPSDSNRISSLSPSPNPSGTNHWSLCHGSQAGVIFGKGS